MKATILDFLSLQDIYNCEIKRIRPNNTQKEEVELIEYKDYDVALTKTTHGSNQYCCFKITFGKHEAVRGFKYVSTKLYLRTFLVYPYLFLKTEQTPSADSRSLSFQSSCLNSDGLTRGTLSAKIICTSTEEDVILERFIGKYQLHFDYAKNMYFINIYQKRDDI